nr:type II secretion system minor pseudopilin GspJ [Vibrio intestinalis]
MSLNSLFSSSTNAKQSGFTLIELLVALAIFAFLSIGAQQVLSQVQRSNEISLQRGERLKTFQRTLVFLDNDFRQMATRQMRTNGEEPSTRLIYWQDYLLDSDSKGVLFSRLGWHNPQQQFPRGEVTKVGYRVKDGELQRVWWRYVDTPVGQEGIVMPLINGIEAFEMRFFDGQKWSDGWDKSMELPKAVAVSLTLQDFGKIERIYLTSGGSVTLENNNEG